MTFFFGFLCGLVLGVIITHLTHTYLDAMLPTRDEETGTCPPCNGKCEQGRYCPERNKQ